MARFNEAELQQIKLHVSKCTGYLPHAAGPSPPVPANSNQHQHGSPVAANVPPSPGSTSSNISLHVPHLQRNTHSSKYNTDVSNSSNFCMNNSDIVDSKLKISLTFRGSCIMTYSYNKSQRDALFFKFI